MYIYMCIYLYIYIYIYIYIVISAASNVGNIIKQHNSTVMSQTNDNNNRKCNCRSKPSFPLN